MINTVFTIGGLFTSRLFRVPDYQRGYAWEEQLRKSGEVLTVGQLAREYGFTDVDGLQPPPFGIPGGA